MAKIFKSGERTFESVWLERESARAQASNWIKKLLRECEMLGFTLIAKVRHRWSSDRKTNYCHVKYNIVKKKAKHGKDN